MKKNILIATGIFPPDIGGPAQYALNIFNVWKKEDHFVKVATYNYERNFPSGIRHLLYFIKLIIKGFNADFVFVLDTFSAAIPAMYFCKIFGKKYIIRTGGDFLWEAYVERTGKKVLLRNFYKTELDNFSQKERKIFNFTKKVLNSASYVIFSTDWQKNIFEEAYSLDKTKNSVVENYCGERLIQVTPINRVFIAGARNLKWKNTDFLKDAFNEASVKIKKLGLQDIELSLENKKYQNFLETIRISYAVVLISLGDISPNMIFDAIRAGVPFIVTKEVGTYERIKDIAIFVDPLDKDDIVEKIVWLADPNNRSVQVKKVKNFNFTHNWEEIAGEILEVGNKI